MKKTFLIFLLAFLACFTQAQMPVFRNQFTTNVPGAYVRGNSTFGTGGLGSYTFNGQMLLYVDPAGGVDFMISTNVYGVGTPLIILRNGTWGFNADSIAGASINSGTIAATALNAANWIYAGGSGVTFGTLNLLPRLQLYGGGIRVYPQVGTSNYWVWATTNGTPQSVVNSNGWFGILTNNPQAELHVNGDIIADNLNASLIQDPPLWDDCRIALGTLSNPSAQPGKVTFAGGLTTYGFDAASTEQLDFELQIPHGITTNNAYGLRLHLHWTGLVTPAGANTNVVWGVEYSFANPGQVFPTTTITNRATNGIITAYTHRIAVLCTVTNLKESGVIVGRIFREGGNTSDNYATDAAGLSLDGHYGRIKMGSDAEFGDY